MDSVSAGASLALPIAWGVAARPLDASGISGDLEIVVPSPAGAIVAVSDGLGHGVEAAIASNAAASALTRHPDATLPELLHYCHAEMRPTRGAALSLAVFDADAGAMTWTGVGNVDSILVRADPAAQPQRVGLSPRGGVVGYRMPPLRIETLPIFPGDWLLMATDGIRSGFHVEPPHGRAPHEVARSILRDYGKTTDDALVLAVRYLGRAI